MKHARSLYCPVSAVFAAIMLATLPNPACAQLVTYNNQAAYQAASTANTTYAFSGPAPGNGSNVGPSFTDGPLTFAAFGLYLDNDGAYGNGVTNLDALYSAVTVTSNEATALSFTVGTYYGAQTVAINVNGAFATDVVETGGRPNTMFVGFTDTVPITSLTFANASYPGEEIDFTQFQAGKAIVSTVPEPSTWALLGAGIIALGAALHRRSCVQVAV